MSRSKHAAQGASLPFNHHLHPFLTFLKHERGFADATIINRERSLKPFLGWLVAEDVPLSTVSPVTIPSHARARRTRSHWQHQGRAGDSRAFAPEHDSRFVPARRSACDGHCVGGGEVQRRANSEATLVAFR